MQIWFRSTLPDTQFVQLAASGHFIFHHIDERGEFVKFWFWLPTDDETISLIQKVTEGECPIGVLADWMEERKGDEKLAGLLRSCDPVGFSTRTETRVQGRV